MSIWLPWDDTYEVSVEGNIRNRKTQYIFKTVPINTGYIQHSINGKWKKAHSLVATLFLPAPTEPDCEVDHIDRNRLNNHASNLRWVSKSINQKNKKTLLRPLSNSKTTYHHITSRKDGTFQIRVNGKGKLHATLRNTLEEAIKKRDEMIAEFGNL